MALKAIITGLVIAGVGVLVLSVSNSKPVSAAPAAGVVPTVSTAATGTSDCSACAIQPSSVAKAAMAAEEKGKDCCASGDPQVIASTVKATAADDCCDHVAAGVGTQAEKDCCASAGSKAGSGDCCAEMAKTMPVSTK